MKDENITTTTRREPGILAQARAAKGLSVKEVAAKAKCSASYLWGIENGTSKCRDMNFWFTLKDLYGWDIKEMLRVFRLTQDPK